MRLLFGHAPGNPDQYPEWAGNGVWVDGLELQLSNYLAEVSRGAYAPNIQVLRRPGANYDKTWELPHPIEWYFHTQQDTLGASWNDAGSVPSPVEN